VPGETPETIRHHVADLIGIVIQAKCCYAMPAPNGSTRAIRAIFVKTMEISEKKGKATYIDA
jgi:hypothetical protein